MNNGQVLYLGPTGKPETHSPGKFRKLLNYLMKIKERELHRTFGRKWDKRARHRLREIVKEHGTELKDISHLAFLKNHPDGNHELVVLTFGGVTYSQSESRSVDEMIEKIIEKINFVLEKEKKKFRYRKYCVCHNMGTTLELKLRWEKANGHHT